MFLDTLSRKPGGPDADGRSGSVFRLQFGCLLAAGLIQFLFLVLNGLFHGIMYRYMEDYLLIPCIMFLGITVTQPVSPKARRFLLLGLGMAIWFVITQTQHRVSGQEGVFPGPFFCAFLLAFPFASVAQDGRCQTGLKMIAWIFVAVSVTLVACTVLLLLQIVPSFLEQYVYWDGARLIAMWHPNICGCLFMIGIGFCLGFSFRVKRSWQKCLLLALTVPQFVCLSLTNSRAAILLTCALVGGTVFFAVWKGGWKRFLLGLAAALLLFAGLYTVSGKVYEAHNARLVARLTGEEAVQDSTEDSLGDAQQSPAQPLRVNEDGQLQGKNGQGTLASDIRSLNGRTQIWMAAFRALRDNPSVLIWGTNDECFFISYYAGSQVEHAHNSWLEALFRMGILGLIAALLITWIALRDIASLLWKHQDMWKTCVALLTLCLLAAGFLEPYLFFSGNYMYFINFLFLLCVGYMSQWREEDRQDPMPASNRPS